MSQKTKSKFGIFIISIFITLVVVMVAAYSAFFTETGNGMVGLINNRIEGDPVIPTSNEVVMPPNSTLKLSNANGSIEIKSGEGLKRYYSWDGATRSIVMWPRTSRWYGSFGLYFPGPGYHWLNHNGIKRAVVEEGQQHFNTIDEALAWLHLPYHSDCTYRDDGLVVCYSKDINRSQLSVDVWQIYVGGKTLSDHKESAGDRIWVYNESTKPNIFRNSKTTTYYTGGHKPTKLIGSNNGAIQASWDGHE